MILTLGRWVLAEACRTGRRLGARPGLTPDFFLSVNLSSFQVQQTEFIAEIEIILEATGLVPSDWSWS